MLVQADETPHCWQRQWMGAGWELAVGGMSQCVPYYAVCVWADLPAPLQPTDPRESK